MHEWVDTLPLGHAAPSSPPFCPLTVHPLLQPTALPSGHAALTPTNDPAIGPYRPHSSPLLQTKQPLLQPTPLHFSDSRPYLHIRS